MTTFISRWFHDHRTDQHDRLIAALSARQNRLERRMSDLEQTAGKRLGDLIGVVVAEIASLREGVRQKDAALAMAQNALADSDARAAQMVGDALAADSAADAERLAGYADALAAATPPAVEVPAVPVPDTGEPATPPTDSDVTVPATPEADAHPSGETTA